MKTRSMLRSILLPAAVGLLSVGVAWAGAGLAPVSVETDDVAVDADDASVEVEAPAPPTVPQSVGPESGAFLAAGDTAIPTTALPEGWYHVGAAKVNLYPRPDDYGGHWNRNYDECQTFALGFPPDEDGPSNVAPGATGDHEGHDHNDHLVTSSPWPENPDCLYMGGFGLGPENPIVDFDSEIGLWVRTVAISSGRDDDGDGAIDASILSVIDAEGWLYDYANKQCPGDPATTSDDGCGWKQIHARLAKELGVSTSSFISHATHSHAAMDFLGGWGFVPDWYMQQAVDSIEESVRRAVDAMEPARLEVGEVLARQHNRERRDTYHAPEDPTLAYLRAFVPDEDAELDRPRHAADPEARKVGRTVATIGVFAAHPTTKGTNGGVAHPDWPGEFAATAEQRFGGMAMHMMSGLGNMSASGGTQMGARLAELLPSLGSGELVRSTVLRSAETVWEQPATNVPLTALGLPGFFDRNFLTTPAAIQVSEEDGARNVQPDPAFFDGQSPDGGTSSCFSASPFSVEIVARAQNIGGLVALTSGPGEMFSNSTNTIEEQADRRGAYALAVAQANDSLGYLPESFELSANPAAGQGGGFVGGGYTYINYEDAYSIDRCFGDANLEFTLGLLGQVFS